MVNRKIESRNKNQELRNLRINNGEWLILNENKKN